MHLNKRVESKNFELVTYGNGNYFIHYNVIDELTDEQVFKNNAFVKTGRKFPTGYKYCWTLTTNQKPSLGKIKAIINKDIDSIVSKRILSGMNWNGYNVWLSAENQKNYSDWYLLACNEEVIPTLTAKFTKNKETIYYKFSTKEEIKSLYVAMVKHINDSINYGRKLKDEVENNSLAYKNALMKC